MKVLAVIALVAVVACNALPQNQAAAAAQAPSGDNGVSIVQENFDNTGIDGYKFKWVKHF